MSDAVEYPPGCAPITPDMKDNELLKKLKLMVETFMKLESGQDSARYRPLIYHLMQDKFVNNNNREIQIYLASCVADIFRLFSPNNPFFRPDDLEKSLSFLVNGLRGLENPESTMYRRNVYLLENLLAMDTFRLLVDLPEDQQQRTLRHILKIVFEITSKMKSIKKAPVDDNDEDANQTIETPEDEDILPDDQDETQKILGIFVRLLSNLLSEVPIVSDKALDVIFFYLINPQKGNYPLAYYLARKLILMSSSALEAPFQTACTQAGMLDRLPDDFELVGAKMSKLYEIICEIYDLSSKLVYPVLRVFMRHFTSEDSEARYKAVKLVGILAMNEKGNLAEERAELWNLYLKRFSDISVAIRTLCATQAGLILAKHPSQRGIIGKLLIRLLTDEDENVRIAAVTSTAQAARRKIEAISEELITAAAGRILDKKAKVRDEAIKQLVLLHAKVYKEDRYSTSDRASIAIIAQKVFHIYSNEEMKDERLLIEKLFVGSIVPYRLPPERRVQAAFEVYSRLPSYEAEYFTLLLGTQAKYRRAILDILILAAQSNKGENPETLRFEIEKRIALTCHGQHSQTKYMNALRQFTNFISKDQHAFELVEYMVRTGYTCEKVEENTKEFLARAYEKQGGERPLSEESASIVKALFERAMPLQFDSITAKELCHFVLQRVKHAECDEKKYVETLPKLLQLWKVYAQHYAHCFAAESVAPHILEVAKRMHCPSAVEAAMQVLLNICSQSSVKASEQSWCQEAVNLCIEITKEGTGRSAKRAVLCICKLLGAENARDIVMDIANTCLTHLSIDDPLCATALQTLGRSIQAYPSEMREQLREKIRQNIVQDVLLSVASEDKEIPQGTELDFDKCPPIIRRKIAAMKYLVRFLTFVQHDDYDASLLIKIIDCFTTFLIHHGDLHFGVASELEKACIRAVAGSSLLRLAYTRKYVSKIPVTSLDLVAKLLLDDYECVRYYIARKIKKAIYRKAVGVEYIGMLALAPLVREDEVTKKTYEKAILGKLEACLFYYKQISLQKVVQDKLAFFQPELALPYAIHFLSHSGYYNDFDVLENLEEMATCLNYIIECLTRPNQNYDLDLALALLQSVKDSLDGSVTRPKDDATKRETDTFKKKVHEESKKMWVLADMSMALLAARSKQQLLARPHHLPLSNRYFISHQANTTLWAPPNLIEQLRTGKWKKGRKGKGNASSNSLQSTKTNKTNAGRTKRRAPSTDISEEEAIDDEETDYNDIAGHSTIESGTSVSSPTAKTHNGRSHSKPTAPPSSSTPVSKRRGQRKQARLESEDDEIPNQNTGRATRKLNESAKRLSLSPKKEKPNEKNGVQKLSTRGQKKEKETKIVAVKNKATKKNVKVEEPSLRRSTRSKGTPASSQLESPKKTK